jgi:tripartite-type tricarboxylate transporter receptor subunit TctC
MNKAEGRRQKADLVLASASRGSSFILHPSSFARGCVAVCIVMASAWAGAQEYPSRPIRLIMPNAPGSSADTLGRLVALKLAEALGQQIVVDNRAGAGGALGLEIGKSANPDGYTIITSSISALTVSPHIRKGLGYDPIKDFEYVSMYSRQGTVLVAHPAVPAKNLKELIEYAKAKQGKINMASAGPGSTSHFSGSALMMAGGFTSLHVPYKGGGPSVAAVASGESQWTMPPSAAVMTLIRAGRLRAIAQSFPQRTPLLPLKRSRASSMSRSPGSSRRAACRNRSWTRSAPPPGRSSTRRKRGSSLRCRAPSPPAERPTSSATRSARSW